jgi:hypothetical protein
VEERHGSRACWTAEEEEERGVVAMHHCGTAGAKVLVRAHQGACAAAICCCIPPLLELPAQDRCPCGRRHSESDANRENLIY